MHAVTYLKEYPKFWTEGRYFVHLNLKLEVVCLHHNGWSIRKRSTLEIKPNPCRTRRLLIPSKESPEV